MPTVYLKPEDVSDAQAAIVLEYLNSESDAEAIAARIELEHELDIGVGLARRLIRARDNLGGRFENLQQEFVSIMRDLHVEEADAIETLFGSAPRLNTSRHSHYSRYLDDELRDLIAEKEGGLIERYGYTFEQDDSSDPPIKFPPIQIGGMGF